MLKLTDMHDWSKAPCKDLLPVPILTAGWSATEYSLCNFSPTCLMPGVTVKFSTCYLNEQEVLLPMQLIWFYLTDFHRIYFLTRHCKICWLFILWFFFFFLRWLKIFMVSNSVKAIYLYFHCNVSRFSSYFIDQVVREIASTILGKFG